MRMFADAFFRKRYVQRAVVLEMAAAVPAWSVACYSTSNRFGISGTMKTELLDEAENERMHLMTFVNIAQPSVFERILNLVAQGVLFNLHFLLYLFALKTAHRVFGYLEEEAVVSYTQYLAAINERRLENVAASQIATDYWKLEPDAQLRDVVEVVREDEAGHRDRNHGMAAVLTADGGFVDAQSNTGVGLTNQSSSVWYEWAYSSRTLWAV